ncbi:MAG: hypothetical protein CM1200mP39_25670 [Dehalococcoidia bacterium]|nr:MAG: hypothetical protein CM1200mP39_25670 [Dehalococcoidia bacterium]
MTYLVGGWLTTSPQGVHGVWINGIQVSCETGDIEVDRYPGQVLRQFKFIMLTIEYYLSVVSPWSYLGHRRYAISLGNLG